MKKILFFSALALLGASSCFYAQTTILEETFSVVTNGDLPVGWETSDLSGQGLAWVTGSGPNVTDPMGYDGNVVLTLSYTNSDVILSSPSVNLMVGNTFTLSFLIGTFTQQGALSPNNHYAVYVIPASSTFTGTETPILEEDISEGDIAVLKTVDLSGFAGQSVKIYFRQYNYSEYGYVLLDTVKVTQQAILEIKEVNKSKEIGVYPNPTSDYIYLKSKAKIDKVEIFDTSGRKIYINAEGERIDIRNLQPGTYLLKLEIEGKITSQKFIKK